MLVFSSNESAREKIRIVRTPVRCISGNIFITPDTNKNGRVNESVKAPKHKNQKPESNPNHKLPNLKFDKELNLAQQWLPLKIIKKI